LIQGSFLRSDDRSESGVTAEEIGTDEMVLVFNGLTLVVPDKADMERDAVCQSWERCGGSVIRIGRFWEPPEMDRSKVRLYGPDTFCLVLAQKLDLHVLTPNDSLLTELDIELLQRDLREVLLSKAMGLPYPQFIKPVTPKAFRAAIYESREDLDFECQGLEAGTRVLTSEIVEIVAEARCFLLDESVRS
jgi:hypothetical protein